MRKFPPKTPSFIYLSGKGASSRSTNGTLFAGSVIFLADEAHLHEIDSSRLTERIGTAIGSNGSAIVWVGSGHEPRITVIHHQAGQVAESVTLPNGISIPAGSTIAFPDSASLVVRGPPSGPEIKVPLEGPDTGVLIYSGTWPYDVWICYFFYKDAKSAASGSTDPSDFAGLRFRISDSGSAPPQALVRFDPSRPFDRSCSNSRLLDGNSLRTHFRTPTGGVLALSPRAPDGYYVFNYDPTQPDSGGYYTLAGLWNLTVAEAAENSASIDLMPGISGSEYLNVPADMLLQFIADGPAFAPGFLPQAPVGPDGNTQDFPLVSSLPGIAQPITTAWIYVVPPPHSATVPAKAATDGPLSMAGYYSQSAHAPFYTPEPSSMTGGLLTATAIEAAPLLPDATSPNVPKHVPVVSFPLAPYAGIELPPDNATGWIEELRRFEGDVLASARSKMIYSLAAERAPPPNPPALRRPRDATSPAGPIGLGDPTLLDAPVSGPTSMTGPSGPTSNFGPTGPATTAVTPQGMLSIFGDGGGSNNWRQLILAQSQDRQQRFAYTQIQGKLREALLANQLFLVVSDVASLYACCSIRYCITDQVITQAQSAPYSVPKTVTDLVQPLVGCIYESFADYFCPALLAVLGNYSQQYGPTFVQLAECAQLTLGGWTFDVSSWLWADPSNPTILVLKFADGDIESFVADRTRWTLPEAFNDDEKATQAQLKKIIAAAKSRYATGTTPELQYFVESVLAPAQNSGRNSWNGVLYLNPAVPTNAFPPAIEALAAGLPPGPLRAHHLGINLSSFSVNDGVINMVDSSLFGLILYDDPTGLLYQGQPYDFKVVSLHALFANSTIASFTSQVELLVAKLFGELSSLPAGSPHGNNILLNGTLQKGVYNFSTSSVSKFAMTSFVLGRVTITSAQFLTLVDQSTNSRTVASFILNGSMTFKHLGDFDLFGFGPGDGTDGQLAFSNLFVTMTFNPNDPKETRTFTFVAGQMNLDISNSTARPASLPRRFPLQVAAMRQSQAQTDPGKKAGTTMPGDLGFIPVEMPLTSGDLGPEWYGLELTLSFGSPGALAPTLGFTGALLCAWAPDAQQYNVDIGIRLPGSGSGQKSLTIMGPLQLSMQRLNFLWDPSTSGYLLRFQNIALSFLGLSFPPGGQTNALLFGDPDPNASNSTLGWYLAYKKNPQKNDKKALPKANRDAQRRGPDTGNSKKGCNKCRR